LFSLLALLAIVVSIAMSVRNWRLGLELDQIKGRLDALERRLASGAPAAAAQREERQPPVSLPNPAPPFPPPAPPPLAGEDPEALEAEIGGRLLQYAGMVVLVLGVAFFLRYAFEHRWMSPVVRVTLGVVLGVVMAAGGLRISQRYRAYGLFLAGGGVAVLYLSVYAGLNLYFLFGQQVAFALLVIITAGGAVLADRTNSLALAAMAVCGGFATPFLVGGDRDAQITLFAYVALLVAATTYLAHRRAWPWLNVVSLVLTAITVVSWAATFYTTAKYLRTELFLTLYCAMFLGIFRAGLRSSDPDARRVAWLLLAAPVGYHAASLVILLPHGVPFLVYLIAITVLGVVAGLHYRSVWVRLAAWAAVAPPLGNWIDAHQSAAWVPAAVPTILAIFAVHLVAQVRIARERDELGEPEVALLHVNGVGVFAALYEALLDVAAYSHLAALAGVIAVANAGLWALVRAAAPVNALHWAGVALTLTAIAVAIQFDGPWAVAMWATEGAAVFWMALRTRREWLRAGAGLLLALAIVRWFGADVQETTMGHVAVANPRALTGIYIIALLYGAAWLQRRDDGAAVAKRAHERAVILVAASALTLFVISLEITSFWAVRPEAADAYLARELMLSAAWALYAGVLVAIGIRQRYAPIRYFAIALFGLTLAKVFLIDLETLGGMYRVAGFVVVGLILLVVSFLYQRVKQADQ
jgi:uncharacterized membrane protein